MSARIPDTHAEAWALLPWLANGRIAADGPRVGGSARAGLRGMPRGARRAAPGRHADDARCSRPRRGPAASDEQRSFNKLWARIEASEAASAPITGTGGAAVPAPRASRTVRWLAAAVVVQAIGLGVLGLTRCAAMRAGQRYRHGADGPEPRLNAPAVRIVFAPEASMATINTLLTHQGLSIVVGPGHCRAISPPSCRPMRSPRAPSADSVAAVISKDPNVTLRAARCPLKMAR